MGIEVAVVSPNEEHFDHNESDGDADIFLEREDAVFVLATEVAPNETRNKINR